MERIKNKIMGTEGKVCFEEDVEAYEISTLRKALFGSGKLKDFDKYVETRLFFKAYGDPKQTPVAVSKNVTCPRCGNENDVSHAFADEPATFAAQLLDLEATVEDRLDRQALAEAVKNKNIDQYAAWKKVVALQYLWVKSKRSASDLFKGVIYLKCEKCHEKAGELEYAFTVKLAEPEPIGWAQLDQLSPPLPEILSKICGKLNVLPKDLDHWLKAEWAEKTIGLIHEWQAQVKSIDEIDPNIDYQIDAFLTEIRIKIEPVKGARLARYRTALDDVVREKLVDLAKT
jgi:hypothetical protein